MEQPLICLRCGQCMEQIDLLERFSQNLMVREAKRIMKQGLQILTYRCPECGKLEFFQPKKPQ
ncbi:MAG: hypothetical protein IKM30_01020 [Oscillospiraceae bacterium]|nr:hypothetical protein [Oscillospiraceae bacterium]